MSNGFSCPFVYYSRFESGHRKDYMSFVEQKYGAQRVRLKDVIFSRLPVLFLMVEERPLFFIFTIIVRSLFGYRTSGLLFRVKPLIEGKGLIFSLKRLLLRLIKKNKHSALISIVPESIYPEVSDLCEYSIYDFQFWDKLPSNMSGFFHYDNGVAVLGRQDLDKGFNYLPAFLSFCDSIGEVFIAGRIDGGCKGVVGDIRSICTEINVKDDYVSNEEMDLAYRQYKYIWCCYAPWYDQSSGILGRALQYGNIPVVRKGSISERYCGKLASKYLAVDIEGSKIKAVSINEGGCAEKSRLDSMESYFLSVVTGVDVQQDNLRGGGYE